MLAAGIPAAIQAIGGAFQMFAGQRMLKKLKRPGYDIPDEFNQNVQSAQAVKNLGGLSQAAISRFQQDTGRNITAGMQGLRGRGGAVAGISNIMQGANDAAGRLAVMDSEEQRSNFKLGTQLQMNAVNALANQKLAQQNWDKFLPFQEKRQEAQALIGAGMQNMFGSVNSASKLAMTDLQWNDGANLKGMFGKG